MRKKKKQVNIAMSDEDYERLIKEAKKEKRNLNQYIRLLLNCEEI